jgi:hypothetical protein
MAFKAVIIFALLLANVANACDWKTITRNEDGSYRYSMRCHIEVGKNLQRLELTETKLSLTEKKLEYTFEQLNLETKRADMLSDTVKQLDRRISFLEKEKYFWAAGGVLATLLFVYLGGKLNENHSR